MNKKESNNGTPSQEVLAKAKKDAFRLLSFRARSTSELRDRMLRKKYAPDTVQEVLSFCAKQGFLDDEKFAKLYAVSRMQSRPTGKRMMRFELQSKGVSAAVAERALGSIEDFDEKEVALEAASRRHRLMKNVPAQTSKARIYGFLKRRGFSQESVSSVLSRLYHNAENME